MVFFFYCPLYYILVFLGGLRFDAFQGFVFQGLKGCINAEAALYLSHPFHIPLPDHDSLISLFPCMFSFQMNYCLISAAVLGQSKRHCCL